MCVWKICIQSWLRSCPKRREMHLPFLLVLNVVSNPQLHFPSLFFNGRVPQKLRQSLEFHSKIRMIAMIRKVKLTSWFISNGTVWNTAQWLEGVKKPIRSLIRSDWYGFGLFDCFWMYDDQIIALEHILSMIYVFFDVLKSWKLLDFLVFW